MTFSLHKLVGLPAIAAAAFFMQALDATILNTALPAVARSLDRSPLAMQLAVVGYTLTVAMLIPVSGWLADRFGTRRVFISAVNFFILGSLLCALSTSLPMLVASRVLQGIGGAMMMPVARLAVLRAYPRTELVAVLNFISIPGLVGPVVGPLDVCHMALDLPDQHPHRAHRHPLRLPHHAGFHGSAPPLRLDGLFPVRPEPRFLFQRP